MVRKFFSLLLPKNSKRRVFARRMLVKIGFMPPIAPGYYDTLYQQAHQHVTPVTKYKEKSSPLISIIVPAYNTKQRYIDELVYSVVAQTYTQWELVLVNASTDAERSSALHELGVRDSRIRVIETENMGISGNTNIGIENANGEYIAFSDHDDVLDPSALQEVATTISQQDADVIYTDEDKITDNSEIYYDPHFKPDWNPDLFTHVNYINHLTVVRKTLLIEVGLLNPKRDGAQDYDLLLRVFDKQPKVAHIAKVLYHWRAADGSTARDFSLKSNVADAASEALREHFARVKTNVTVKPKQNKPGFYSLQFEPYENIAIIILPFASDATLRLYNEILVKRTRFSRTTQLIVPKGTAPRFDTKNLSVISLTVDSDYLTKALTRVKGEVTICIGTIAFPERKEWLQEYPATLRLKHVNAVSPLLLLDGNIIDECGLIRYNDGFLSLFRNQIATNNQTFFGNTDWVRNVDRLTGNVMAVRTKEFRKYLNTTPHTNYGEQACNYAVEGKYNLVYADERFNRQSIRLGPAHTQTSFFNKNIDPYGDGYALYMAESAAVNVMMHIAEGEGIDL
ncbi:MAG: glycosyltransferase [Bacteroidia bacterium]|nr:glycosyltransferase [Bacteroidia bacterium]